LKRPAKGGLDRAVAKLVQPAAFVRQAKHDPSAIFWVGAPRDELARLQAPQDAGESARMHLHDRGHFAQRDAGEAPNDAQEEALGCRDAEVDLHALGARVERVIDRQQQAHEAQRTA